MTVSKQLIAQDNVPGEARFTFTAVGLWHAVQCYRWRALAVFAGALIVGLILIVCTPPAYESNAVLLVKFGQQQVYRPPLGANATPIAPTGSQLADDMVMTQVEILRGREAIEPVIQRIGIAELYPEIPAQSDQTAATWSGRANDVFGYISALYHRLAPPHLAWFSRGSELDKAVRKFQRDLSIQQARGSLILEISYRNHSPSLARLALEELIQEQRRISATLDGSGEFTFYLSALVRTQKDLVEAEARLNQFRSDSGVVAFKEQLPILLERRQKLVDQRGSVRELLAGVEGKNSTLVQQKAKLPSTVTAYSETHFASHQVGVTRAARNPVLADVDAELQQNEAEYSALNGRLTELAAQLDAVDAQIRRASELDGVRTILENNVAAIKESFRDLKARAQEAALLVDLSQRQSSTLSVAQRPTLSDMSDPVRPAPLRYMLIATTIGVLGALTIASSSMRFAPRSSHRRRDKLVVSSVSQQDRTARTEGYHG